MSEYLDDCDIKYRESNCSRGTLMSYRTICAALPEVEHTIGITIINSTLLCMILCIHGKRVMKGESERVCLH